MSTGVFQSYFVPSGKSPLLAIPSSAFGVSPCFAGTSLPTGVNSSDCGFTLTVTGTSSLVPSGYVTTTVPGLSPGVEVSTGVFQSYVVPAGRSPLLEIPSAAFGVSPCLAGTSLPTGVNSSDCGFTFTVTGTSSLVPSGYVTTTVPGLSPGVVVSTGVFQSYFVPSGKSPLLAIPSSAFGVSPCFAGTS